MHQYHRYWEAVKDDPEKTAKLIEISDEMHNKLKAHCPAAYYDMLTRMHCVVYGPHFDEHTVKMAVARMKNVDDTTGEHWTMEQTNSLAEQNGIRYKEDFYYVMNMMYSDYSKIIGNDVATYIKMAKAYMCDPDAPDGKAFIMWIARMRADKED